MSEQTGDFSYEAFNHDSFLQAFLDVSGALGSKIVREGDISSLKQSLDLIPAASFILSERGEIIAANKNFASIFNSGIPVEAHFFFGNFIRPVSGLNVWLEKIFSANVKERIRTEALCRLSSGQKCSGAFDAVAIRDRQSGKYFISCEVDVSSGESEVVLRLASAIEQAAENIVITTIEGFIIYVNPSFEKLSGYSHDEITGKNASILRSGELRDDEFYQNIDRILMGGSVWSGRMRNRKKNGDVYEKDVTISPVKDSSGKIISFVSVSRDVTESVRLEKELRQAQKMQAIGTLAGGIAHDFNNLLMSMMGYTEMALTRLSEEDRDVKDYLSQVCISGKRARDLIRQILTFSRQSERKVVPVQAGLIIKEALKLIRSILPSTIRIASDIRSSSSCIADPTELHQVIMNLCTNASHAMMDHGGTIDVVLDDILLASESEICRTKGVSGGRYIVLSVKDSGKGMDSGILERIFEPFFTTKKLGEGTGMGLAVVHGIVKDLSGCITVESRPGRGSIFKIYIPATAPLHSVPEQAQEHRVGNKEVILFADDEPMLVDMMEKMLCMLNYSPVSVNGGSNALEIFKESPERFDLVITDLTMPGMTGLQLAREVLSMRKNIPVVVCSGYSEIISREDIEALGIKAFLTKPVSVSELSKTLSTILNSVKKES